VNKTWRRITMESWRRSLRDFRDGCAVNQVLAAFDHNTVAGLQAIQQDVIVAGDVAKINDF